MLDEALDLVCGHLVGQLPDHTDPLLGHQFLQIPLEEDSVVVAQVGVSRPTHRPVCLEPDLCPPGVVVPGLVGVAVEDLLQGGDGLQGTVCQCWQRRGCRVRRKRAGAGCRDVFMSRLRSAICVLQGSTAHLGAPRLYWKITVGVGTVLVKLLMDG